MNTDQIQSLIRQWGGAFGTLLALAGLVPADKWTAFVTAMSNTIGPVSTLAGAAIAIGASVWGVLSHTQAAQIQAVNHADNGVKVVPLSTPGAAVNRPLK